MLKWVSPAGFHFAFSAFSAVKSDSQAGMATVRPFFQTMRGRPRRRFSARTLRATRRNARSPRTTNAGVTARFPFPAAFPFLFMPKLMVTPVAKHYGSALSTEMPRTSATGRSWPSVGALRM